MSVTDKNLLDRTAQPLVVEFRACSEDGYAGAWQPVYDAQVLQITLNSGAKPNVATVKFPSLRWHEQYAGLDFGVNIRIRTNQPIRPDGTPYRSGHRVVLFQGFLVNYRTRFAGGTGDDRTGTPPFEENAILCLDTRWLLSVTSPVWGVFARSRNDYQTFETTPVPRPDAVTDFTGRRAVFNADARPDRDATPLMWDGTAYPIFASPVYGSPQFWTVRQMLQYCCYPGYNKVFNLFALRDATQLTGVDHADWDRIINHVMVDTLDIPAAVELIAKHIGWTFREDYTLDGPEWIFYKPSQPAATHRLFSPFGHLVPDAVRAGAKLLFAAEFDEDITPVINTPIGFGAPERYEFTAELVPAWTDADLSPDSTDDYINVFLTEAQIQEEADPNSFTFYRYYHRQGSSFRRDVGRKWALNEAGDYSNPPFERGAPFEFSDVIDAADAFTAAGRRRWGLFRRALLEALSFDRDGGSLNSVGVLVELSFDGGQTWHVPQAAITVAKSECAIYIEDANISELLDPQTRLIDDPGQPLHEFELNYFTSLCRDKVKGRSFVAGQWQTRCRVTASVQLDQRLIATALPGRSSGSPFHQRAIYDFSDRYGYQRRSPDSRFAEMGLPAWTTDEYDKLTGHLDALRDANEDMSINGRFTLDRLWLGDGAGTVDFALGDGVEGVEGRGYSMAASLGGERVFPEIMQIVYDVPRQKQHLITRDLRLSAMKP